MDPGEYHHWLCRGGLWEESVLLAQWRACLVVTEGSRFVSFDLLFFHFWTLGNCVSRRLIALAKQNRNRLTVLLRCHLRTSNRDRSRIRLILRQALRVGVC